MSLTYHSRQLHHDPLGFALIVAAAIHLVLIMGIGFDINRNTPTSPDRTVDVTIVRPLQKIEAPEKADFLANANQQGATEHKGVSRPTTTSALPLSANKRKASQELLRSGSKQTDQQPSQKIVTSRRNPVAQETRKQPTPVSAPKKTNIAQLLSSTRQEISRLTSELDENTRYAANRPRHKAINASTQEYIYASYLTTWRKKVERIGNLNYPEAAKRKKLYGDLLLHVALRADGTVQKIRVVHSSGHKTLDDAAIRIVRLAAPFAPFPPEIRKQVDILDITRTWQFLSNNSLFSGG